MLYVCVYVYILGGKYMIRYANKYYNYNGESNEQNKKLYYFENKINTDNIYV